MVIIQIIDHCLEHAVSGTMFNFIYLFIQLAAFYLQLFNYIYMVIKEVIDDTQTHCRLPTPVQLLTGCPIEDLKCFRLYQII